MERNNQPAFEKEYLVFADIDTTGFVVGIYENLAEARLVMKKIWELGNLPTLFSLAVNYKKKLIETKFN